mgnify:CR=1 FL=1
MKNKVEILDNIILSLYTGEDYTVLNDQIDLISDLNFESITLMQLVVMIEDEFDMTIPDEVFSMEYFRSYKYLKKYICGDMIHGTK